MTLDLHIKNNTKFISIHKTALNLRDQISLRWQLNRVHSKFVWHSTEIIRQSKIKEPLRVPDVEKCPGLLFRTLEYEYWSKKRDGMQWWWQWLGGCAQLKRRGGCGGHAVAATAKLPSLTGCHAASLLFFKRACPPYSYCYVMTQVGSTNGLGLYTV